ncbi:hypothetical protein AB2912_23935 [Escherichia coli]|uniref:hypothetical protein n=1 Tax=Escherichia coli TaxID=562 RepID=UPI0028DABE34|nr:hypothetical protein [Escherichia coli]
MIGSMPNCDRRWMPNHERFEYQTVIDSDAILQYRSQRGKIKMKSLSGYKGEYETFFYKNKFKEIDEKISDGDLLFGMVVVIQEIKLHIIRRNDFRYVIQADLTNDIWNYADTKFLIVLSKMPPV